MSNNKEKPLLCGIIEQLFHQSARYCAGLIRTNKNNRFHRFAGKCYIASEGEHVILAGQWVDDEKYGRQFRVSERVYEDVRPLSTSEIASWLSSKIKGVGNVRGKEIAQRFTDSGVIDLAEWLDHNATILAAELAGVTDQSIRETAESWRREHGYAHAAARLAGYGLTARQIEDLWSRFKGSAVSIVENDPYLLVWEAPGFGFSRADDIARRVGRIPRDHPSRIQAAVRHVLLQADESDGSTCLPEPEVITQAMELLSITDYNLILNQIHARTDTGGFCRLQGHLALPWNHSAEEIISNFVRERRSLCNPHLAPLPNLQELITAVTTNSQGNCQFDESQVTAIQLAAAHHVCLITGGAGSGKSHILAAIANLYRLAKFKVALAAPTGKAARRIEECAPGFEASTIHKVLGCSRDGFAYDATCPIPEADVVILDELSMLSSDIGASLLSAINPNTSLVLIGDPDQLPPVGAGALLRDCVRHGLVPIARLEHCHRQAGILQQNCRRVLHTGTVAPTCSPDGPSKAWFVIRTSSDAESVYRYIGRLYDEILPGRLGYDPLREVQFVSPAHSGLVGTRSLNALLQRLHQRSLGVEVPDLPAIEADTESAKRAPLMPGDKVIQTRNNYELGVMNGHQGFVREVIATGKDKGRLAIEFEGPGEVTGVPRDDAGDIRHAYCLTAHKTQGSQWPCVVVVCHRSHRFMLHRNWLYTALTRARQTAILIGDSDSINFAARRQIEDRRRTLLPLFFE